MELGSDDGVKVWLNDKQAHSHNIARPLQPGSDKVNLNLHSGWNSLLLKITRITSVGNSVSGSSTLTALILTACKCSQPLKPPPPQPPSDQQRVWKRTSSPGRGARGLGHALDLARLLTLQAALAIRKKCESNNTGKAFFSCQRNPYKRMDYRRTLFFSVVALMAFAVTGSTAVAAEEIKDSACMECHSDKTLYKTNAAGKGMSLFVDVAKLKASVHKTNTCASCHSDITDKHPDDKVAAKPINCAQCHEQQSESYGASVHGLALAKGRKDSATCSDCHDGHTILPPTSPGIAAALLPAGRDLRRVP